MKVKIDVMHRETCYNMNGSFSVGDLDGTSGLWIVYKNKLHIAVDNDVDSYTVHDDKKLNDEIIKDFVTDYFNTELDETYFYLKWSPIFSDIDDGTS